MTQSGALDIEGTTTLVTAAQGATIVLGTATNAFTGAVTITTNDNSAPGPVDGTYAAHVTIDGGTTQLRIAASTIDGDLTLTSGNVSGITDDGTVTVAGDLAATTNASDGVITLNQLAVDGTIALVTHNNGAATVVNDAGLNFAASTVGGALSATATAGDITDSGVLAITGTSTFTVAGGQSILLTESSTFAAVEFAASGVGGVLLDVEINDSNAFELPTLRVTRDLTVTAGDDITDDGTVTVGRNLAATTNASDGVITLNQLAVDGTIALVTHNNGAATVVNDAGLNFAASTVGGALSATATNGHITQTGALDITGVTTIVAGTSKNITLTTSTNDFKNDVLITSGNNVSLVDANAIDLGASTVSGTYAVTATAGGDITDSGVLAITGTSTFTVADGHSVLLTESSTFATVEFAASGGGPLASVTINDSNGVDLGALTTAGDLTVTAGGDITDSDTLTVGGDLVATTNANNGVIDLGTLAVTGSIALATHGNGDATVVNATGIEFAASDVNRNLSATATTGTITQSGALDIEGTTTLVTAAQGQAIVLGTATNAFTGAVTITTNDNSSPGPVDGTYAAHVTIDGGTTALGSRHRPLMEI